MTSNIIRLPTHFETIRIEIQPSEAEYISVFQGDRSGGWRAFITCDSPDKVSACIEKANQELKKKCVTVSRA